MEKKIGIFLNWNDCNNSIKGFKNAKFKKFKFKNDAQNFIDEYLKINKNNLNILSNENKKVDYYVYKIMHLMVFFLR